METLIPTLILTIGVMTFFVLALGFRMLFDKKAEFKGGCASNNPMLRDQLGACTACGKIIKDDDEECELPQDASLPSIG